MKNIIKEARLVRKRRKLFEVKEESDENPDYGSGRF